MLITAEEAVKTAFTMLIVLGMAYFAAAPILAAPAPIATTTRKVVLEKLDTGAYRWKLMEAPIPGVGDHQVLVQGTGGVSVFAMQFAAALGARVIVTSSSDEKLRRALAHGARDGINYTSTPAWADRVRELTDDHGADVIVDVGGKDTLEQSTKCLAYSGTLSIVGGLSGYGGSISSLALLAKAARAQGVFVGKIVIRL
jgi:NADPH:quinone reductase-like Zn-dependent oxidoreductase